MQIQIKSPTYVDYQALQSKYNSLTCTCSSISISYSNFVLLKLPTFHQICSSPFVSHAWISAIFANTTENQLRPEAFLGAELQLISSFCDLSQQVVLSNLESLGTQQFVSTTFQSSMALAQQVNTTITQFYVQTSNWFSLSLDLILNTTLGNQLVSAYQSSWYYVLASEVYVIAKPYYYGNNFQI